MNGTKKIREQLGLSQYQLAVYLSVSRSQIALSETGRRSLPTGALVKLAALATSLQVTAKRPPIVLQQLFNKQNALAKAHTQRCNQKAALAKHQLNALQTQYQECEKIILATSHLLSNLPQGKHYHKDLLWLELLQTETLKKMKACGPWPRTLLALKIQTLEQEALAAVAMKG